MFMDLAKTRMDASGQFGARAADIVATWQHAQALEQGKIIRDDARWFEDFQIRCCKLVKAYPI